MRPSFRKLRLRQLDETLAKLGESKTIPRPRGGWIREIRQALGMTTRQMATRMRTSQPAVTLLERSERENTITLESLERAARAMDCELVYALVPRTTLQGAIEQRVRKLAIERVRSVSHTMRLEDQAVADEIAKRQVDDLVAEMLENPPRTLWS